MSAGAAWHQFGGDKPPLAQHHQCSVSSHHCFHGGLFPAPLFARHSAVIIAETTSSPKTLQHSTQNLLVPAPGSRGDAPGAIPPLHRLPGALWDPWPSGVGWSPLQPLLLQFLSLRGSPKDSHFPLLPSPGLVRIQLMHSGLRKCQFREDNCLIKI